ncbi:MAG: STM4011 family radical SAM protein [Myxococcota bacterium]
MTANPAVLRVLYRGPLESCNFDCHYCPFGKVPLREDELSSDFAALDRFVTWALGASLRLGVFFTPWGEALVHAPYQRALARLSHADHIERVAIQTNLSAAVDWLFDSRAERIAFWATWHPDYAPLDRFLRRVEHVRAAGARLSVGVVAQREHFQAIAAIHERLPPDVYLWINANKRLEPAYSDEEVAFLTHVDPLFPWNRTPHQSLGQPCDAGRTAITVDGEGQVRRCHFVPDVIGHIDGDLGLGSRVCPKSACRCHIGYVHLPTLGLGSVYGRNVLERIPAAHWPGWTTLAERRGKALTVP